MKTILLRNQPIDHISQLKSQRRKLLSEISNIGEFRPGNLSQVSRKCGKPNCRCAQPQATGHHN